MTSTTITKTITYTETLNVLECANCAMLFAITDAFERQRRADGQTFYCPSGHSNVYRETEAERLRKKLAHAEQQRDWAETSRKAARDQAERAERSAAAYKGRVTRLKNRAAAGVCPCCNRSFENLRRHMAGQHPDYAASDE